MDTEFPRGGGGGQVEKSWKFQGVWEYCEAPRNGKSWGVGGQPRKTLCGGYGYFLEPHIVPK